MKESIQHSKGSQNSTFLSGTSPQTLHHFICVCLFSTEDTEKIRHILLQRRGRCSLIRRKDNNLRVKNWYGMGGRNANSA